MPIPKSLREKLIRRHIVPFIGAGVSMSVRDRQSNAIFPSWRELLIGAADRLEQESKIDDANLVRSLLKVTPPDFLEAAARAQRALGPVWYDFLKEKIDIEFDRVDPASLELARQIWRLGSNLVITTNYDEVLRWACPKQHDLQSWDIEAPVEQASLLQEELDRPVIWHLHGRISNSSELILSPDGYTVLYPENNGNAQQGRYKAALSTLRHQLASRSFLFVGFSLDDEYFEMQLKSIREMYKGATGPHYAIVREEQAERVRKLQIEPLTVSAFGDPLISLLAELAEVVKPATKPVEPPAAGYDQPDVPPIPDDRKHSPRPAVVVEHESWFKSILKFLTTGAKEWLSALLDQPTQPPFGPDVSFDHELGRSARLFVMVIVICGLTLGATKLIAGNANISVTILYTLWTVVFAILIALVYLPVAYLSGVRIWPLNRDDQDGAPVGKTLSVQQVAFTFFYIFLPWIPIFVFIRANFLTTPQGILKDFLLLAPWLCLIYIIVNFAKAIRLITNSPRSRIWLSVSLPLLLLLLYDAC